MKQKPNILIFMTDQQRGDSITNKKCLTPNLDKFREKSITFTNAHCPSPHCCPSRATFMSGLYPSQHGVWHNVNVSNAISRTLNDNVKLWSEDLAEDGYNMAFSGKWHISAVEEPTDRGWKVYPKGQSDNFIDTPEKVWNRYAQSENKNLARQSGEIIREGWNQFIQYGLNENPFCDQDVINTAKDVIKSHNDEPWCQYIGPVGPHDPYTVPQQFLDMYNIDDIELPVSFYDDLSDKPNLYQRTRDVFGQLTINEHKESIRHYLAFCSYEDYLFGQILEELEKNNQIDNTIIIFLSDHGDYNAEHGLWCKGLPCFEGAYHIPCIIGGTPLDLEKAKTIDNFISLADFAPTILDLAKIPYDANRFFGASLMPFLEGKKVNDWRTYVYTQSNGNEQYGIQRSVRNKKWKYVYNGFDFDELYDLENDPSEMNNCIKQQQYQTIVKDMCQVMWELGYKSLDNCINPYIMVGLAPVGPSVIFNKYK